MDQKETEKVRSDMKIKKLERFEKPSNAPNLQSESR